MSGKRKFTETNEEGAKVSKTEDASDVKAGETVKSEPELDVNAKLEAAAEAAARIAAQYSKAAPTPSLEDDAPFQEKIEINDIRNRYVLTKGPTQMKILADTGASVTTKGVWYPDKSMADKDPPLYLHVTAQTQEILDAGIKAVQELIDQELGPLIDQSRFRDRDAPRERRKWPEEKVFLDIEPMRNFNVRAKVVGPGGLFVKYIQQETQTRVQIKGINSGFVETETGRESDDPIHIHVTGPDQVMVDKATEMARDLLVVVHEEWNKAKVAHESGGYQQQSYGGGMQNQQQGMGGGYAGQGMPGAPMQGGYGGQQGYSQQSYGAPPLPSGNAPPLPPSDGSAPPPPPPSAPGQQPIPAQQAGGTATPAEWAAYWNSLDAASQAYYMQYYAPQAAYAAAPVAPPAEQKGGSGKYGAVPPPNL